MARTLREWKIASCQCLHRSYRICRSSFDISYWISIMRDCLIMNAGWSKIENNWPTPSHKLNVLSWKLPFNLTSNSLCNRIRSLGFVSDEWHDKASKFFPVSASVNLTVLHNSRLSLLRMREITFIFTPACRLKTCWLSGKKTDSPESVESICPRAVFPFEFWGLAEFSLIPKRKYFLCETP